MSDAFSNALQKLTERKLHLAAYCPDSAPTDARPNCDAASGRLHSAALAESEHLVRSALDTFTATAHFELSPAETQLATAEPCSQVEPECPTILQHPCAVPNNSAKNINRHESQRSARPVAQPQPMLSVPQTQPTPHAEPAEPVPACPALCPEPENAAPAVKCNTQPASRWATRNAAAFSSSPAGKLLVRLSQTGTGNWQQRIEGVLENRRQAAAAVVAVCVAVLWLTAPTTPTAESIPQSEASDMDSILAEFDSADQHRPEPAEPLDSSFENLIIPQTANANSPPRRFGTDGVPAGSDQSAGLGSRDGSNLFLATPATSATAEDGSSQKVRVRLTKSITPLN
jgi:hypothetical protein